MVDFEGTFLRCLIAWDGELADDRTDLRLWLLILEEGAS
jgi:hypothetical protein